MPTEVYILPAPEGHLYTPEPPVIFAATCADGRKVGNPVECGGGGPYTPAPQPMASGPGPGGVYTSGGGGIFQAPTPPPIVPSASTAPTVSAITSTSGGGNGGGWQGTVVNEVNNAAEPPVPVQTHVTTEDFGPGMLGLLSLLFMASELL